MGFKQSIAAENKVEDVPRHTSLRVRCTMVTHVEMGENFNVETPFFTPNFAHKWGQKKVFLPAFFFYIGESNLCTPTYPSMLAAAELCLGATHVSTFTHKWVQTDT